MIIRESGQRWLIMWARVCVCVCFCVMGLGGVMLICIQGVDWKCLKTSISTRLYHQKLSTIIQLSTIFSFSCGVHHISWYYRQCPWWPRLYNTVLRACEGQPSVVLALYSRLQGLGLADHVTYSTAINAFGWQDAMLLLQQMHGCLNCCWHQSAFQMFSKQEWGNYITKTRDITRDVYYCLLGSFKLRFVQVVQACKC